MATEKKQRGTGTRGSEGFHRYYRDHFTERWDRLVSALESESPRVAWTFSSGVTTDPDPAARPYHLDPASVLVAHLLPPGENVLDLCAAPGGKALVLLRRFGIGGGSKSGNGNPQDAPAGAVGTGPAGSAAVGMVSSLRSVTFTANERSRSRRARLHRVLQDHLPPEVADAVTVTGHDASRWGLHEPDRYDAILADVPCSSERHVLAVPGEISRWSRNRVRRLAVQQFAILAAAIDSLRPGGHVLYATCALTPEENDAVLARSLERRGRRVRSVTLSPEDLDLPELPDDPAFTAIREGAESTDFGLQILPDRCGGAGPLYAALLRRT